MINEAKEHIKKTKTPLNYTEDEVYEILNLQLGQVIKLISDKIKEYENILTRTSDSYMEAQIDELKEMKAELEKLKI